LNALVRAYFSYPDFSKNEKKLDVTFGLDGKENEDETRTEDSSF
jgi:hypothetical protein